MLLIVVSVCLIHDAVLLLVLLELLLAGEDLGAGGLLHVAESRHVDVVRHVDAGYPGSHVLQWSFVYNFDIDVD